LEKYTDVLIGDFGESILIKNRELFLKLGYQEESIIMADIGQVYIFVSQRMVNDEN
jgi:hypothetical protein